MKDYFISVCAAPASGRRAAIENMGGLTWLYEKHMAKFRDTYADSAVAARNYILCGKYTDARILIHSVKGLSGTLGLRCLFYAAAELEQAILTCNQFPGTDSRITDALTSYESCLNKVISTEFPPYE